MPWQRVAYSDNADVLALLADRQSPGVLPLLDEESLIQSGSDANFVHKLRERHGDAGSSNAAPNAAPKGSAGGSPSAAGANPHLSFPRTSRTGFSIKHYAGDVTYEATGMRDKNRDALHPDLAQLLATGSQEPFVRALFDSGSAASLSGMAAGRRPASDRSSVGSQFMQQLGSLMRSLKATTTHYCRCVKPNPAAEPLTFDLGYVAAQLRSAGVLEAVRIARLAFPTRLLIGRWWPWIASDGF